MARPHHRKKHKTQLRNYKHQQDELDHVRSRKSYLVFTVLGGLLGLAIGYFATETSWLWMISGVVLGSGAGYYFGKKLDGE